jgi:hypothetical protein
MGRNEQKRWKLVLLMAAELCLNVFQAVPLFIHSRVGVVVGVVTSPRAGHPENRAQFEG